MKILSSLPFLSKAVVLALLSRYSIYPFAPGTEGKQFRLRIPCAPAPQMYAWSWYNPPAYDGMISRLRTLVTYSPHASRFQPGAERHRERPMVPRYERKLQSGAADAAPLSYIFLPSVLRPSGSNWTATEVSRSAAAFRLEIPPRAGCCSGVPSGRPHRPPGLLPVWPPSSACGAR